MDGITAVSARIGEIRALLHPAPVPAAAPAAQAADAFPSVGAGATPAGALGLLLSTSPVLRAGTALVVLLAAAALSVFKPRGLTRHGWRTRQTARPARR